ncbi:MAG TPA: aminotransferase class I/II-fold pyridoxal phosphate-dependent enzyme [Actinomycetota bacterium]|nr:aminotransferase class I/II-fold pyridoxal phosphate-dependent enzyme [Actinomycetota bacterium]
MSTTSVSSWWLGSRRSRGSRARSPAPWCTSRRERHLEHATGIGTRAVHPRRPPPQDGTPVAPVLDQSSTYSFSDGAAFAKASSEKVGAGYVYTRWANPTIDAFEAAVADLEGADDAEAFASGMGAISAVFLGLCSSGDKIASARQLYGNTYSILSGRLERYGITTEFADVHDLEDVRAAAAGAKLLYCETIGNPRLDVADLPALAAIARGEGIPLVVDNTFASPVLCRPLEHGASLVVHSATKYLGGHHDLIGGIVCGEPALVDAVRAVARDFGATFSPFNAWLSLRGIATLHLRVERSSTSALAIANALLGHSSIEKVYYPGLPTDPNNALAEGLLEGKGGGTLGFDVGGGRERVSYFQDSLRIVKAAASLGGTHSLIVHAASITHTQLSDEELVAAGIGPGFCRLSVGLEDPDDLIEDLISALDA